MIVFYIFFIFCFFNVPATTVISTLSLHDALPIYSRFVENAIYPVVVFLQIIPKIAIAPLFIIWFGFGLDRKSTRLNSSHRCISYAVFCLKKKTERNI